MIFFANGQLLTRFHAKVVLFFVLSLCSKTALAQDPSDYFDLSTNKPILGLPRPSWGGWPNINPGNWKLPKPPRIEMPDLPEIPKLTLPELPKLPEIPDIDARIGEVALPDLSKLELDVQIPDISKLELPDVEKISDISLSLELEEIEFLAKDLFEHHGGWMSKAWKTNLDNAVEDYHELLNWVEGYDKTIFNESYSLDSSNRKIQVLDLRKRTENVKLFFYLESNVGSVRCAVTSLGDKSWSESLAHNGRKSRSTRGKHPEIVLTLIGDSPASVRIVAKERRGMLEDIEPPDSRDPDEDYPETRKPSGNRYSKPTHTDSQLSELASQYWENDSAGFYFYKIISHTNHQGQWFGPYSTVNDAEAGWELMEEHEDPDFYDEAIPPKFFKKQPGR